MQDTKHLRKIYSKLDGRTTLEKKSARYKYTLDMVVRAYGNVIMFVFMASGKWQAESSAIPEDGYGENGS